MSVILARHSLVINIQLKPRANGVFERAASSSLVVSNIIIHAKSIDTMLWYVPASCDCADLFTQQDV